ncbi:MAG TPA: helix-turn-helix transcriptional regulator [Jatrophihabitantaceae bacterium]|jgi:DNA-binding NarL/FixJ family response regulator
MTIPLDDEEVRLLSLVADGLVMDAIARRLNLSERTVRRRLRALCDRIGVDTPVQAVVWAVRVGAL